MLSVGLLKKLAKPSHNRGPLRLEIMSAGRRPELKEGLGLNTSPKSRPNLDIVDAVDECRKYYRLIGRRA